MYHPWRRFRGLARWTLEQAPLPAGVSGLTVWPTGTVILDRRLSQVERRCTICHELVHIERGPLPDNAELSVIEEGLVERISAGRLIELHDLGEALAWSSHISEAADMLWVTEDVLRVRLDHLSEHECDYLQKRLAFRD